MTDDRMSDLDCERALEQTEKALCAMLTDASSDPLDVSDGRMLIGAICSMLSEIDVDPKTAESVRVILFHERRLAKREST